MARASALTPRLSNDPMPPSPQILIHTDQFVVLNKPAGLPVHAGPGGGPTVEDLFPLLSRRRTGPWLAHRLDRDTAGCLVVALRRTALLAAQAAFAAGTAEKCYWAVTQGGPAEPTGTISIALGKQTGPQGWRMRADPAAPPAVSNWRVLGRYQDRSWIEVRPHTGRTHQVRAHLALLGCPVLGDPVYGTAGPMLHLLARSISLPLDPPLSAEAPPPPHMQVALRQCGWRE